MISFQPLKHDMEVDIDGMLVNEKKEIIINFKNFSYLTSQFFYSWFIYYSLFKSHSAEFSKKHHPDTL